MKGLSILLFLPRTLSLVACLCALISLLPFFPYSVRGICGLASIICSGVALAYSIVPSWSFSFFLFPVFWSVPVIILGTAVYSFSSLSIPLQYALALLPPLLSLRSWLLPSLKQKTEKTQLSWRGCIALCGIVLSAIAIGSLLLASRTENSVLGPWSLVPSSFFLLTLVFNIFVFGVLRFVRSQTLLFFTVSLSLLVASTVILILFPLGFGFDPTIHQTAERTIQEAGVIIPKTPYYIGYYVVTIVVSKLTSLPIIFTDRVWLPFLFSLIFIPLLILIREKKKIPLSLIATFFSAWIVIPELISPTPWGAAYVLTTISLLFSVPFSGSQSKILRSLPILSALAALCIHPIAGIIACGSVIFFELTIILRKQHARVAIMAIVGFLTVLLIPLSFFIQGKFSKQLSVSLHTPQNTALIQSLPPIDLTWLTQARFNASLDVLSVCSALGLLLFLFLSGYGFLRLIRTEATTGYSLLIGFAVCIVDYLIMILFFSFPSLISYEQSDYAQRLLLLALLFLIVPFAVGASAAEKILNDRFHDPFMRFVGALAFAGVATGLLYLSYPRNDAYMSFHGYNISATDIRAVKAIEEDAKGLPYVVLANQVTSAAALREFGFKRYLDDAVTDTKGQVFYYPIPTGSPLYLSFLQMLASPNHATANQVMERFGVKLVYLVINRYEPRGPNSIGKATENASKTLKVSSRDTGVFVYDGR